MRHGTLGYTTLLAGSVLGLFTAILAPPCSFSQNNGYIEPYATTLGRGCGAPGHGACSSAKCVNSGFQWCSPPHNAYDITGCPSDVTDQPGLVYNVNNLDLSVPAYYCTMQPPTVYFYPADPTNTHPPDYTFYITTDLHFGAAYDLGWVHDEDHVRHTRELSSFGAHNYWPAKTGFDQTELVGQPEAVLVSGDLTHNGSPEGFQTFRLLWEPGLSTDALNIPVGPGYGNHDSGNAGCAGNDCALRMWDYFDQTLNSSNVNYDSNSHNYSWDWGSLHVIQLNTWAGDTTKGSEFHNSGFAWFADDLIKTGTKRPIIIVQHYGLDRKSMFDGLNGQDAGGWWSTTSLSISPVPTVTPTYTNVKAFLDALKGYNVVGMFTGHVHATGAIYTKLQNGQIIDDFVGGTGGIDQCGGNWTHYADCGGRGDFFVTRYRDFDAPPLGENTGTGAKYLEVASVEWQNLNLIPQDYPPPYFTNLSNPKSTLSNVGGQGPPYATQGLGCRKLVSNNLIDYTPLVTISAPTADGKVTVTNKSSGVITGTFLKNPLVLKINGSDINAGSTTRALDLGGAPGTTNQTGQAFVDRCAGVELARTDSFPYFAYHTLADPNDSYAPPANSDGTYTLDAPNVFLMSDPAELAPGQSITFHVGFAVGRNPTLHFLSVGRDMLAPQTNNVLLSSAHKSASVNVSSVSGKSQILKVSSTQSWLTVKTSAETTPATLILEADTYPQAGSTAYVTINTPDYSLQTQKILVTFGEDAVVDSSPSHLNIAIDGKTITTPQQFIWQPSSRHTLIAPKVQPGYPAGTTARFERWEGPVVDYAFVTPANSTSTSLLRADYADGYPLTVTTQYKGRTTTHGGTVTVTPSAKFNLYHPNQQVIVIAHPAAGNIVQSFSGGSGEVLENGNYSLIMSGPETVTVTFAPANPAP